MRSFLALLTASLFVVACGNEEDPFGNNGGSGGTTSSAGGQASMGGAGGTGGAGTGGAPACVDFGEPCSACELAACEARYCECYGNVDCGLYASCALECMPNDADCLQACNTAHPDGITDAVLLNDCAAKSCPTECAAFPLYDLTPCQICLYESCEPAMNACLAIPDCAALLFCLADCMGDGTCETGCYGTYPGGFDAVVPVGTCSMQSCTAECGT